MENKSQKILSIDVGMRHLAYCVCDMIHGDPKKNVKMKANEDDTLYKFSGNILFWGIINLCNDTKKNNVWV